MIVRFRHAGLERFFTTGSAARIQPAHRRRLRLILTALHTAQGPRDMGLPGLDLHPLKDDMTGFWSVGFRVIGVSFSVSTGTTSPTLIT
jgi:proteic killer suppression protein